ncbi:unnamed protein product [Calypogeia fissa]
MASELLSQRQTDGGCSPLISALIRIYVAAGFILIMVFALYMTLLMSPELLRRILEDVMQCEALPGYLSPNSTIAESSEFDECSTFFSKTENIAPTTSAIINSEQKIASVANSTEMAVENETPFGSKLERKAQKFSVLVGILTTASASNRRNQARLAYAVQSSNDADFTVRFVLGKLEKENNSIWVGMENATYGDIVVLPCKENVNSGKTFTFFTTLAEMGVKYDYVMKTDDDSYVRFSNLGKQLSPMSRNDLYYGYSLKCDKDSREGHFLTGAGYIISWDLVLWINNSPIPRNKSIGVEDILVGDWFRDGGVAKNRPFTEGLFYDYIDAGGRCAKEFRNDTVLVHKLKTSERWQKTLAFFEKDRLSQSLSNSTKLKFRTLRYHLQTSSSCLMNHGSSS